jgi:hypothetical protein
LCHRLALEQGLIPGSVFQSKTAVRDYVRAHHGDSQWAAVQGIMYGPRLRDAEPFPGVLEFFRRCQEQQIDCKIISHKTKYPAVGDFHDLHKAAETWLNERGFLGRDTGLYSTSVYFESSRQGKLMRIAAERCVLFIDDLPECLTDPAFPQGVERMLFDPLGSVPLGPYQRCESWPQISQFVFGALER